ncbi:MAG TPA: hypothetical protein VN677_12870 [Gemmatimonadaceae bacterium]|nr:hypothetical protein [Gemmatimonadaceae bacterium]
MTQSTVNSEQVTALFEERQRYESWLATLESRRGATPAHIYERVHTDYSARLRHVVEQLAGHRAVLQEMESGLLGKLSALDVQEARHRDEAAETDLRAAVGELSGEQHREVTERTSGAVTAIQQERGSLSDELNRLRAVLVAAGATPQPLANASGAAAPAAPAAHAAPAPHAPSAAPVARPTSGPVAAPASREQDEWDAAFDKVTSPAPQPSGGATPAPAGGGFDDLEFLKSMSNPRTSGEGVTVGSGAGMGGDRAAASGGRQRPGSGKVRAQSGSQPSALRTTPSAQNAEQVKTLKCQECGTLNYPTEWYCERCGAELAAM